MNKQILILGGITLAIVGITVKMNTDTQQKQQQLAIQIEQQKQNNIEAMEREKQQQEALAKNIIVNQQVSKLQSHYPIDYQKAKTIVETPIMDIKHQMFYRNISFKWDQEINKFYNAPRLDVSRLIQDLYKIRNELANKRTHSLCEEKIQKDLLIAFDSDLAQITESTINKSQKPDLTVGEGAEHYEKAMILFEKC